MRPSSLLLRGAAVAAIAATFFVQHSLARTPYDGTLGAHGMRFVRTGRATVTYFSSSDRCWAREPNCGSWRAVCMSEGWRCDPPRRDWRYNDGYNYGASMSHDGYHDGDSCRPWVACSLPGHGCPSGTYCAAYRNDFACFPLHCPHRRW